MSKFWWTLLIPWMALAGAAAANPAPGAGNETDEEVRAAIGRVIDDSIGWFKNKDFDRLFQVLADDPSFFIYHPDSKSDIHSADEFRKYAEFFRNPDFVYNRHQLRDLKINLARSREVAWWSCVLDDCAEYKGKPSCWKDCRWTGVLEKREGRWVIVQMHFSFAADRVAAEAVKSAADGKKTE